ncbi:ZZ-type zinc finger-containing protein 3 [Contarinia nasturtii]|uniref:ZZ-type zinc finger-containing protein 3 n=1 Tax=Contarinia nasturtii TaxID=265458 RepID=UPI0012D48818|nr:ZZ-type zinc finger-containing protein 3 [Contarinia nasturtii]
MDHLNSVKEEIVEESFAENEDQYYDGDDDDDVDENNSDNEDFYFESDHLALRGNSDYRSVLRTIVILEAQRIEASKHIDKIAEMQKRALEDPEDFLKKLISKEGLDLPARINIQNIPKIKFEKYNMPNSISMSNTQESKVKEENDFTVRGRVFNETKPETFNQLWTCEEQRRLEELLVEYPPEPIEMRRFAKIAKALGNRTPRQVASRLQKYFQKLHAAGLPVPGRIPRNARSYNTSRKNRMVKHMVRPTTFFPSNYVPVNITEDDDNNAINLLDPNYYRNGCSVKNMNDEDIDNMVIVDEPSDTEPDPNATDTIKMAAIIKRVKREKEREYSLETTISEHNGYKCDYCDEDPISGTRWHCITCKDQSTDYCSDCLVAQTQDDNHHSFDHIFIGYRVSSDFNGRSDVSDDDGDGDGQGNEEASEDANDDTSQFIDSPDDSNYDESMDTFDKDYVPKSTNQTNNYLDPNFLTNSK